MGYGDDLLVTSLAAKIKKQFPEYYLHDQMHDKLRYMKFLKSISRFNQI